MNNVKSKLLALKNEPLARGAAILFIGSFVVNFASYIFNLVVGRMLGPVLYGEYLALVTIVYLISVPFSPAQTIVVKYVSQLKALGQYDQIKKVLILVTKYITVLAVVVTAILVILAPVIQASLKINSVWLIVLMALTFGVFTPPTVLNSAFTGLEKYVEGLWTAGVGIVLRILLTILFIAVGWQVGGVFLAMIIASLISYIISWNVITNFITDEIKKRSLFDKATLLIKKLIARTDDDNKKLRNEIVKYSVPVTIATIGSAAMTQIDIILVKSLFSSFDAGIYSSLAIIGKVIPFFTMPLLTALFPQLVARVTRGEDFIKPFFAVQAIIITFSLAISAVYYLFPELMIRIFFGEKYLSATQYIGVFGLFQTAFTVMNAYVSFFLATGNNKYAVQAIGALGLQTVGIFLFHDSLTQVIQISALVCALFIVYFSFCTLQIARSRGSYDR